MVRALIAALLLLPSVAFASVSVVDVMYDAPGTDTGREWVEFKTDSPISDLRTWRFLEGGTKHKITGTDGAVPAGALFILAANAATFRTEHPEVTALVFDTAMSLSNSGETFSLVDGSGVVVVSHTYTPAPKPVAEKPPAPEKKVTTKTKVVPRVLGVATSSLDSRGTQVAAAIESTSPEWAWFSFGFLGLIILAGFSVLTFMQFKK